MVENSLHELELALRQNFGSEVYTSTATRNLYSTDASIYQIEPLGVVYPRDEQELQRVVELASEYGIPLLPRGSGSSLAGQAVGKSMVLDCSRYLNKILEVDPASRTARVQPGVVLDAFNRHTAEFGLMFGPDPASADRATFGGMIGNNSAGAHSIRYGMTADHIYEIEAILSDGSVCTFHEISLSAAEQLGGASSRQGAIYSAALDIRKQYREDIIERWPATWRRASGYSLNYLLPWASQAPPQWENKHYPPVSPGRLNLAPVMVGSEGTLIVVKSARIGLVKKPSHSVLVVMNFESIAQACDATPALLESAPSAVELVPRALIERARAVPAYADLLWFVKGDPAAILVVEYSGEDPRKLENQARALGKMTVLALTEAQQSSIWKVRKVGLGLLMSRIGDAKPLPFIEDVAVPVERLGDFVREFEHITSSFGTTGDFYAHASAGCLHVRPIINLKTVEGVSAMRGITQAVVDLTVRMGGALSGEHGDGLARSEWLEAVYGPKVIDAFRQLKMAADPKGLFNPGKIVNPPPMEQNLRYSPGYQTTIWKPVQDFGSQGGLAGAIEMCNGAGVCRKSEGVMCPSFQASQDEMHSTRGRANLLRAMVANRGEMRRKNERDAFEALDLCVECKGCKAECPSAVDMAKLKVEFLNNYYRSHRRPVRDYLFAYMPFIAKPGSWLAPISGIALRSRGMRKIIGKVLGLSAERDWPIMKRPTKIHPRQGSVLDERMQVILFADMFSKYMEPDLISSAWSILDAAGLRVHILDVRGAGRPLISKGFLDAAAKQGQKVIDAIKQLDPDGSMPIIGLEPSELYTLRDEYLSFFPADTDVMKIAARAFMLEEFLIRPLSGGRAPLERILIDFPPPSEKRQVLLHGHCYQKTQPPSEDGFAVGVEATKQILRTAGCEVEEVQSGCCGMAGSFGYEAEHYEFSLHMGELSLFPAVRAMTPGTIVAAPGASCRSQILTGTGKAAVHPVRLVNSILLGG